MKILGLRSLLAKVTLLPALVLAGAVKEDSHGDEPLSTKSESVVNPTQAVTEAIPTSHTFMISESTKEARVNKYHITEAVTDREKFQDPDSYPDVVAFFRVNTPGGFDIWKYKDGKYGPAYLKDSLDNNLLFPTKFENKPVAIVDPGESGFQGGFEIYYVKHKTANPYHANCSYYVHGAYCIHYRNDIKIAEVSPLIVIPEHTTVSQDFLHTAEEILNKTLPKELQKILLENNIRLMLAGNVEDGFYHYHPASRNLDSNNKNRPPTPTIEKITENGKVKLKDNRKMANCGGHYRPDHKIALLVEKYISYYNNSTINQLKDVDEMQNIEIHELMHGLDDVFKISSEEDFAKAHKADIENLDSRIKERSDILYLVLDKKEAFAELTTGLLGGLTKSEAKELFTLFPQTIKYIREKVLPRFRVNISVEKIREEIYPDYLKEKLEDKQKTNETAKIIQIPDMLVA